MPGYIDWEDYLWLMTNFKLERQGDTFIKVAADFGMHRFDALGEVKFFKESTLMFKFYVIITWTNELYLLITANVRSGDLNLVSVGPFTLTADKMTLGQSLHKDESVIAAFVSIPMMSRDILLVLMMTDHTLRIYLPNKLDHEVQIINEHVIDIGFGPYSSTFCFTTVGGNHKVISLEGVVSDYHSFAPKDSKIIKIRMSYNIIGELADNGSLYTISSTMTNPIETDNVRDIIHIDDSNIIGIFGSSVTSILHDNELNPDDIIADGCDLVRMTVDGDVYLRNSYLFEDNGGWVKISGDVPARALSGMYCEDRRSIKTKRARFS